MSTDPRSFPTRGRSPVALSPAIRAALLGAAFGALLGCNGNAPGARSTPSGDEVVSSGDVALEVDARVGARFVSFARRGTNWLSAADANATNYGSTFWTSPQSDWNWPPPPEIDELPYEASRDGATLTLRGAENAALGLRVSKVVAPSPSGTATGSIGIQYLVQNDGTSPRSIAPWEVTRVHPEGVVFFPTGATAASSDAGPPLPTRQAAGATWFDVATIPAGQTSIKYFADGARGWLAHVRGGLLFVKKFADVPPASAAPGEAEIEIYVNGDRAYVELEVQGAYGPIAPGAMLAWPVRWFLVPVPAGVDASVGSAALVSFVDGL